MTEELTPVLPEYTELNELLKSNQAIVDAATAHGIICSFNCIGNLSDGALWLERVLGAAAVDPTQSRECRNALLNLYDISSRQLQDMNLGFQLLLPSDEVSIDTRVKALGAWCQGFLQGIQLAGVDGDEVDDEEVGEFFDDITDIAHIDYEDIEAREEDEANFVEISEYVRVGVMMVYYEYNMLEKTEGVEKSRTNLH